MKLRILLGKTIDSLVYQEILPLFFDRIVILNGFLLIEYYSVQSVFSDYLQDKKFYLCYNKLVCHLKIKNLYNTIMEQSSNFQYSIYNSKNSFFIFDSLTIEKMAYFLFKIIRKTIFLRVWLNLLKKLQINSSYLKYWKSYGFNIY